MVFTDLRLLNLAGVLGKTHFLKIDNLSKTKHFKKDVRLSLASGSTKTNIYISSKAKFQLKSTLINSSGKSTGFRYRIDNFNQKLLKKVNKIKGRSEVNERIKKIEDLGGIISFDSPTSEIYKSNLKMIDSLFDKIIGELLLVAYIENEKIIKKTVLKARFKEYCRKINLDNENIIYKIKNFLNVSAISMVSSKRWSRQDEIDGGFVVIKKNRDLEGYFNFSLEKFKKYLWENTYFETPSASRHDFGYVYEENGNFYFDLNLQVRFK